MRLWTVGVILSRRCSQSVPQSLIRCCSSSSPPSSTPSSSAPDPEVMEAATRRIHGEMANFFLRGPSKDWIRNDIVFENRASGKTIVGGYQYYKSLLLFKVWGNLRFPFIVLRVKQSDTNLEEGSVTIHFDIKGMTQLRLLLLYFPKQLWYPTHMMKHSITWKEGISVIYVDKDGMVYRHIFDNKVPSSKIPSIFNLKESIQEKIKGQVAQPQLLSKGDPKSHGQMNF